MEISECYSDDSLSNELAVLKKKRRATKVCCVSSCHKKHARSYHKFPRDPIMREKWITALKIEKPSLNYIYVCCEHFLTSDFIPRWDGKLRRLKTIAVPSQKIKSLKSSDSRRKTPAIIKRNVQKPVEKDLLKNDPLSLEQERILITNSNKSMDLESEKLNSQPVVKSIHNEAENVTVYTISDEMSPEANRSEDNIEQDKNSSFGDCIVVCECDKDYNDDSIETKAAKVLVELNEKVSELLKTQDIIIGIKDVILKCGEEFYFETRKFNKTTITSLLKTDHQLHAFTGIDHMILNNLSKAVVISEGQIPSKRELTTEDKVILCLTKIRLNLSFHSLSTLFYITYQQSKSIFKSTVKILKNILKSVLYWPTKSEIQRNMPEYLGVFKKTISIFDQTDITIGEDICNICGLPESTNDVIPNDKFKILLGFSKCGLITYVSRALKGSSNYETITDTNKISKALVSNGNAITTDGYFVEEECNRVFIDLVKSQRIKPFCPETALRVKAGKIVESHLENAYRRFTMFKILQSEISTDLISYIDDISVVICGIVNLCNAVIAVKKFD